MLKVSDDILKLQRVQEYSIIRIGKKKSGFSLNAESANMMESKDNTTLNPIGHFKV
jgi:hypothetical protein